jgi:hypothetical protein
MHEHVHQPLTEVLDTSGRSLVEHDTHDIIRSTTTRSDGGTRPIEAIWHSLEGSLQLHRRDMKNLKTFAYILS